MRKIFLSFLSFLLISSPAFSAVSVGKIQKGKTASPTPAIEDSIMSESGGTVQVGGGLNATGNINGTFAPGLTGLSDIGSATITAGRILIADGTKYQSVAMTGECLINSSGAIDCASQQNGATQLTGLSDVGSSTVGAGRLLINDGTKFQSTSMSGDATITSAGVIDLGSAVVGATELASYGAGYQFKTNASITVDVDGRIVQAAQGSLTGLSDVGIATITAGNLLLADGTKFQSVVMSGDCTIASDGAIDCVGGGSGSGATQLTGLSDVGSSTAGAGRLLVNDGTKFQSVASNTGDCFVSATGRIVCNSYAKQLTGLSDVGSSTVGAGRLFINDGTDFNSIAMSGDATITSAGVIDIATAVIGSTELSSTPSGSGYFTTASIQVDADGRIVGAAQGSLTGLSDIGSATITSGRLLIADGTKYQSVGLTQDCTILSSGAINCGKTGAVTQLTGLTDVGSSTAGAGRLLVNDGTKFQSVAMTQHCFVTSSGQINCNSLGAAKTLTGLSDVGSATITAGNLLLADGTSFQSKAMSGDCTITSAGVIDCPTAVGATQLTGLSDVGSATVTAGRLMVADGTKFQSVAYSGPAGVTLSAAGVETGLFQMTPELFATTTTSLYANEEYGATLHRFKLFASAGTAEVELQQCDKNRTNCSDNVLTGKLTVSGGTEVEKQLRSAASVFTGGNTYRFKVNATSTNRIDFSVGGSR